MRHPLPPLGLLLLTATLPAQTLLSGGVLSPEQAAYDVTYYGLELAVDPERRRIDGALTVRARALAELPVLVLDLDSRLEVREVTGGAGAPLAFDQREAQVRIELDEPAGEGDEVAATVSYGGVPRVAPHAPWDGGFTWARTPSGAPWIATTCQTNGADLWWPCKDHISDEPESMDIRITVPEPLVCASNGKLVSVEDAGAGRRAFHWRVSTPINAYCVALNIAPYETLETEVESVGGGTFPAVFYVLPEHRERAEGFFEEFLGHLRWFEATFGPYPFRADKYGIAETPHLGMEHQTIIAYGNKFRRQTWDYDWLHHHELSHEWWGNLVTARQWNDLWLHEGIGTYCQALYVEHMHGEDAYHLQMRSLRRMLANRTPVAPREIQNSEESYGPDVYNKGACVLHTLRYLLGSETLMQALRTMAYPTAAHRAATDGSQCRFADTDDFLAVCEEVSGEDLGWLFEVYLRRAELPVLEARERDGAIHLRWRTPEDLPFPMPVEVERDGEVVRVPMPEGAAVVPLAGAESWDVDPHGWILKG